MSDFDIAVNYVLKNEGGFIYDPDDDGNATNFGISLKFISALSPDKLHIYNIVGTPDLSTIRNLTIDLAKKIYYNEFWLAAPFDKILNQDYCNYIFDMTVNTGIEPAIKCVQRACWAVLKRWDLLYDDGVLGDNTLKAIVQCGFFIMPPLRAERANYYRLIVEKNPLKQKFLNGWLDRTYV